MKTREEWIAAVNAKSAGGIYVGGVIAKVENIDEALRSHFGRFQHTALDNALKGEKAGLWTIVDVLGQDREGNLGQGGELR